MKTHWFGLLIMLVLLAGAVVAQDTVDPDAAPLFATVNLTAGEELDPFIVSVTATGTVDASTVAEGCLGFIPDVPDVVLNWSGTGELLRIFFYSLGDATLTIVTPDDDVLCNDDVNATLLDPMVDIENPAEGRYAIYVGHFELEASFPGFLARLTS